jgi:predicted RNA-binding Zn ribbon-like protein
MRNLEPQTVPGEAKHGSLALVNTRFLRAGEPVDLLADLADAGQWLTEHAAAACYEPGINALTAADAERLRALRESVRAVFEARAVDAGPDADNLTMVNTAAAMAPLIPVLTAPDGEFILAERRIADSEAAKAMARLATDAMTLVAGPDGAALAPCGAHGCIRWFLRTHGGRQWCSNRCGDRVRAARHYARAKKS